MLGLGPHATFIIAAYAATFVAIGALITAILADDRKQRRLLSDLERRGITRRSAGKRSATARPTVTRTSPGKTTAA